MTAIISGENIYQYYLSASATSLTGGTWRNYESGQAFHAGYGLDGVYYLYVKRVSDTNGNISSGNGGHDEYIRRVVSPLRSIYI